MKIASNRTLKVTALLYLREALLRERYEEAAELIRKAKRFGAEQDDIQDVIAQYVNKLKGKVSLEVNQNQINRLRF